MKTKTLNPDKRLQIAHALWGWQPHPTQREWILDSHQIKVAACGRRWGKTEAAAIDIATSAIADSGSMQIIVAPTYDQSRLISNTIERILLSSPITRKFSAITKTPYTEIRVMKSRIMARTANDDGRNLRGFSADRVVVDEAAYVRDKVVEEVISPMLADRNGKLVMISTPFGKNHFYRSFIRGLNNADGKCKSFSFPSNANPHISNDYVEYQRSILTPRQFRVEYEAQFADDEASVFPWEHIQAAIEESAPMHRSGLPIRVAGIDWARYSDYTVAVILEVEPDAAQASSKYRVVVMDRFNKMDWHDQVERIASLLYEHNVRGLAADQTSVGDPVLEMLKNSVWGTYHINADIEGFTFTNNSKRELIDNLALRLARREVVFPNIKQLINELQYYEYEITPAGNVRTAARQGEHDDCVCALALALRIAPNYVYTDSSATSGKIRKSASEW